MGGGIARLLASRDSAVVVGAIDSDPAKIGRSLGEVIGEPSAYPGVIVSGDPVSVLEGEGRDAQVVVVATGSFLRDVSGQILLAVRHGKNVISIAEEMAYPMAADPDIARRIDELAKEHGVSVLGTGINPGFILDTLIITLTSVCAEVTRVRAARINDLSPFGPTVMRTQGVATTEDEFWQGIASGAIVGHIGFPESMHMIADALGWKLDEIRETREPIISRTERVTKYARVLPGMVAGCRHIARAFSGGREVITLEHPQAVLPSAEGVETGDFIWIEGVPGVNLAMKPEIPGGTGTIAISANMIPRVMAAPPGLLTMRDLPTPSAHLSPGGGLRC
jgi:4-hydroxy-tetrahydrodipicolinate reductase